MNDNQTPCPDVPDLTPQERKQLQAEAIALMLAFAGLAYAGSETLYAIRRLVGWEDAPLPTHEVAKNVLAVAMKVAIEQQNEQRSIE